MVARHRRDAEDAQAKVSATYYLAWPVHIMKSTMEIERWSSDLAGSAELICLKLDGSREASAAHKHLKPRQPTDAEWCEGLTSMRLTMRSETDARVVLGGRVEGFKGTMPGIAEEALLSLEARQPLYLMGGFGGCTRDVAETMRIVAPWAGSRPDWPGRALFERFSAADLNNGLNVEENLTLARTPHVDQAVALMIRGFVKVIGEANPG